MNKILGLAALVEAGTGAILLAYPPIVIRLLFGTETGGLGVIIGRLAGIALIGLSVACWPRGSAPQPLYGMLTYNALVTLYLIVVGLSGTAGILLWPAVVVHAALCVLLINSRSKERKTPGM